MWIGSGRSGTSSPFSLIFSVAGVISMGWHWAHTGSPVALGVDFRGGTQVQLQFQQVPDADQIRVALEAAGIRDARIQAYDKPENREMLISLPEQTNESALDAGQKQIVDALHSHYGNPFTVRNVQVVGPTVGRQLEKQAGLATLYSLLGMLVYLWFRFQLIYGVAAVVACFHDTLITVGAFALSGKEISLTVIAAILTLIGYSMNDTIVVFDRIRENLRMSRRESLPDVVKPQYQSDAEPNRAYFRTYIPDGALAVHLWRRSAGRLLVRACGGNFDRHVFVDRCSGADACGVAGLACEEWQGHGIAGCETC